MKPIRTYMGIPLPVSNEQLIGLMRGRTFSEDDYQKMLLLLKIGRSFRLKERK